MFLMMNIHQQTYDWPEDARSHENEKSSGQKKLIRQNGIESPIMLEQWNDFKNSNRLTKWSDEAMSGECEGANTTKEHFIDLHNSR